MASSADAIASLEAHFNSPQAPNDQDLVAVLKAVNEAATTNRDTTPFVLGSAANLVARVREPSPLLASAFSSLLALYLLYGILWKQFRAQLQPGQSQQLPYFWPQNMPPHTLLVNLQSWPSTNICSLTWTQILATAVQIIKMENAMTGDAPYAVSNYCACVFSSPLHLDLGTLMLSMNVEAVMALQKWQKSTGGCAYSPLEVLKTRPAWLYLGGKHYDHTGAQLIVRTLLLKQIECFQVATETPVRLLVDILNQGITTDLSKNRALVSALAIAVCRVAILASSNQAALLEETNRVSSTQSLGSLLLDTGYLACRNFLFLNGDSIATSDTLGHIFVHQQLPPNAKPAYLFSELAEVSIDAETLAALSRLWLLNDLLFGICNILAAIPIVVSEEFRALAQTVPDAVFCKVLARKLQHVIGLLLATSICSKYESLTCARRIQSATVEIVAKLAATMAEISSPKYVWITLFNMVNDMCYSEVAARSALGELLARIGREVDLQGSTKLYNSGFDLFSSTFTQETTSEELVEVQSLELKFLYKFPEPISKKDSEGPVENRDRRGTFVR